MSLRCEQITRILKLSFKCYNNIDLAIDSDPISSALKVKLLILRTTSKPNLSTINCTL